MTCNSQFEKAILHLERVQLEKDRILEKRDILGSYLTDIAAYASLKLKPVVSITTNINLNYIHLKIEGLPIKKSDLKSFLRVEVSSMLPELLNHLGDSHVFLLSNQNSANLILDLPLSLDLIIMKLRIFIEIERPAVIHHVGCEAMTIPLYEETIRSKYPDNPFLNIQTCRPSHNILEDIRNVALSSDDIRASRNDEKFNVQFPMPDVVTLDEVKSKLRGYEISLKSCECTVRNIPGYNLLHFLNLMRRSGLSCKEDMKHVDTLSISSTLSDVLCCYLKVRCVVPA